MAGMKGVEARVVKHTIDTSRYEDAIGRFPDQTDHFQARIDRSARGVERFQSRMAAIGGSAVSHVSQAETSYAEVRYSLPA
ncbi:MAG TPA: hypothetical protein VLE74_01675 [Candidatus Saccharimonadales bacterium]|nr:hypothetical protein [Candidatus Saccharimonadales bacterium]